MLYQVIIALAFVFIGINAGMRIERRWMKKTSTDDLPLPPVNDNYVVTLHLSKQEIQVLIYNIDRRIHHLNREMEREHFKANRKIEKTIHCLEIIMEYLKSQIR